MVQAIASGSTVGAAAAGAGTGAGNKASGAILQTQLVRYQAQLDDWCNCPSRTTPQGKARIQDLTLKVDTIKAEIHQAAQQQQRAPSPFSPLGGRLDTFA